MKLTRTGYRINRNGKIITSIEQDAYKSEKDLGSITKIDGMYYFFNRKQGSTFIYLL